MVEKIIVPQEVEAQEIRGQQAGMTPEQALAYRYGFLVVGGYRGKLSILDLDKLVEQPLAAVERIYSLDRIDDRDAIQAKIAAGAAIGSKARARLTVPSGEVWFLNRLVLTSPAESGVGVGDIVKVNFRVKSWRFPDTRLGTTVDDDGRSYWSADQGTAALDTYTVDLPAQGELGEELRLGPGDVVTLTAELTGAAAGADLTATLTPYGRKVRKLTP
jgi:hypothetical protein